MTIMHQEVRDLKDLSLEMMESFIGGLNLPRYRAHQLFSWLYRPFIHDFQQMTDLPRELRSLLAERAFISRLELDKVEISQDGARKYRFRLSDGAAIESVLIPEEERMTLCLSSQVGCAMKCVFCLTGRLGFRRNLTPAEMVNQVLAVEEDLLPGGSSGIDNIVFMGMGEPLANFDNLLCAIDILTDQRGLDFSSRRVTVSTCGIVPKINELGEKSKVNLAISLHAVNNAVRTKLMPISGNYSVDQVLDACKRYPLAKRKRIMIEYILIEGVNASPADAKALAEKLRGIRCKINLLPLNEIVGCDYHRPSAEAIDSFQQILWDAGYTVIVRTSRGADISAACGQLAADSNSHGTEKV